MPSPDDPIPPRDIGALTSAYRPLVLSVCRRYLHRDEDVDDACQETFARLLRQTSQGSIHTSPTALLATIAKTTSLELIRKNLRRRRREQTANPHTHHDVNHAAISRHLDQALQQLDPADRDLIRRRFFQQEPLRIIAGETGASLATVSRRAQESLSHLADVLRHLGIAHADEAALADHFGDPALLGGLPTAQDNLRFAPDWRAAEWSAAAHKRPSSATRPLRVGAHVSYLSATTEGHRGIYHAIEEQVWTSRIMSDPAIELVGIVEPDTTHLGPIERTLREYELTAGLVSATDLRGLQTLDVILFGINFAIHPDVLRTLHAAVRSGVGLLNEYWLGLSAGVDQLEARDLLLSATPTFTYHEPPVCGTEVPAIVTQAHPLLPGLKPGDTFPVGGCGPAFIPIPTSTCCITKQTPVPPDQHHLPYGPLPKPVFLVGELGLGRIVWMGLWKHRAIIQHLSISPETYILNLLHHLARRT